MDKNKQIKGFFIDVLLLSLRILGLVAKIVSGLLSLFLRPFFLLSRFIFYKVLVKSYLSYFSFTKKLGWDKFRGSFLSFLFSQKTVHILVAVLTVYIAFIGLSSRSQAGMNEGAGQTIMAEIVKSEFSEFAEDELIEEGFDESAISAQTQLKYLGMTGVENKPRASLSAEEEEKFFIEKEEAIARPQLSGGGAGEKVRTKTIAYKVSPGDTISTIAQEFGLSVNTILWENNLSAYSLIRPGDDLNILPGTGVSHEVKSGENLSYIAKKYEITVEELMKANRLTDSSKLSLGQELFIPGGKKASYARPAGTQPAYNPIATIKNIVSSQQVSPNKMAWPTEGAKITQYYSWRHSGLDIANKSGTSIYAADAGTVTYSGWSNGYGYRIDIDHGGGKKTRYAHFSKLYMAKGDSVSKGQAIGEMGTTGWSTGPHLHFEVIIDGTRYNPLNYIK